MVSRSILLLACVSACNFDDGGEAGAEGTGTSSEGTTMPTSGPTTSGPTTTGNTAGSTGATDSTTIATTVDATGPLDSSGTSDGSGSSTGASATTEESSTTATEPEEHHLGHGSQTACDLPLWCAYMGDVQVPAGGPIEGQECFLAPVDPPYELVAMHYSVAAVHTDLEDFELRVYAWDGDVPGELLETIALNSSYATPMEHEHAFEPAIEIDSAGFCIGFATTEPGLAAALGMAVDSDSVLPDVSFVRMEGMCDLPAWEDVIDAGLESVGNWCMDATIRTIP